MAEWPVAHRDEMGNLTDIERFVRGHQQLQDGISGLVAERLHRVEVSLRRGERRTPVGFRAVLRHRPHSSLRVPSDTTFEVLRRVCDIRTVTQLWYTRFSCRTGTVGRTRLTKLTDHLIISAGI